MAAPHIKCIFHIKDTAENASTVPSGALDKSGFSVDRAALYRTGQKIKHSICAAKLLFWDFCPKLLAQQVDFTYKLKSHEQNEFS